MRKMCHNAVGPIKNEFSHGMVATKTLKPKMRTKHMSKQGVNLSPKSLRKKPWSSSKTMLANIPQQIEKCTTNDSQIGWEKLHYFQDNTTWTTSTSGNQKWVPSTPKVLPMIKQPNNCFAPYIHNSSITPPGPRARGRSGTGPGPGGAPWCPRGQAGPPWQ